MSRIVATQVRVDEDLFSKGKILAAIYDESFNALLVRILTKEIQEYEARHGDLPRPLRAD